MKMNIGKLGVSILGDPHLGKVFRTGVPLHRRGEREDMQWAAFAAHLLDVDDVKVHVCMGDLFDAFVVPPEVVLKAALLYLAASENSKVHFYVLRGNHDASRDSSRRSSFDLFETIVGGRKNVTVLTDHTVTSEYIGASLGFVPWHPFRTAKEQTEDLINDDIDAVFTHMDVIAFDEEKHNLLPYDELAARTKLVINGHDHNPREFMHGDMKVVVTGSMQPYSHGEDVKGEVYVTLTPAEIEAMDPAELKDKCVRVVLEPGEELPQLDCLALTVKRQEAVAAPLEEVKIEEFNFRQLFIDTLRKNGVEEEFMREAWADYEGMRTEQ